MKPLILHAGTHKTGTTTIQNVFGTHQEELRQRGLYYPDPMPHLEGPRTAHHSFAHAVAKNNAPSTRKIRAFISHINREARPGEQILLSSEAIYRHTIGLANGIDYWKARKDYLAAVAKYLEKFDLRVILFFRRLDRFAESMYFESVSKGYSGTFTEFISLNTGQFDYDRQLRTFHDVFPMVEHYRYEDAADQGLVAYFSQIIGISPFPHAQDLKQRSSTDHRITLWLAARNRANANNIGARNRRRRFAAWIASNDNPLPAANLTLWPSEKNRNLFLARFGQPLVEGETRQPATLSRCDIETIERAYKLWLGDESPAKKPEPNGNALWRRFRTIGKRMRP